MSKHEFGRLEVLLRVQSGGLRINDACELIGRQRLQVFRLLRGLKQDGPASLLSKRRGRPSNRRLPAEVRILALSIVRERYADFGPTLAAEKLAEHRGCSVSQRDPAEADKSIKTSRRRASQLQRSDLTLQAPLDVDRSGSNIWHAAKRLTENELSDFSQL